jgi:hypothetical protein
MVSICVSCEQPSIEALGAGSYSTPVLWDEDDWASPTPWSSDMDGPHNRRVPGPRPAHPELPYVRQSLGDHLGSVATGRPRTRRVDRIGGIQRSCAGVSRGGSTSATWCGSSDPWEVTDDRAEDFRQEETLGQAGCVYVLSWLTR